MDEKKLAALQAYKNTAFALFILATIPYGAQYVLSFIFGLIEAHTGFDFAATQWFSLFMGFAPVYLVGMPLCMLLLREVPMDRVERTPLGIKGFLTCFLVCFPIMYIGNTFGNLFSTLFSGGAATNDVAELAMETNLLRIIPFVVLSPLLEELIFRKQVLDRTVQYGERPAIVFSALVFALIHGNLFQFFYAFGHGLLFGYIYVRTRRLRYTVILHMMVNFLGSVVTPYLLSQLPTEVMESLMAGELDMAAAADLPMTGLTMLLLFLVAELTLGIVGLFVLVKKLPRVEFRTAELQMPREWVFPIVYCNAGSIQLILCTALFMILSLL